MNISNNQHQEIDEKDDSNDEIIAIGNFLTGEVTVLKHIYYECTTSCALCCKENRIPITEREFAKIDELEDIDASFALESFNPILIPQGMKSGNYNVKAYLIKQKPYSHECYFLDENKMCKIHPVKPFACRMYPFLLKPNDDETVKILIHPESVCKFIFEAEEKESNTKAIVEEILTVIVSNMKEMKS